MALLVIMDRDKISPGAQADRESYKRGDIVRVADDSEHDGDLIRNPIMPPWYLIRVQGVTKAQIAHAMEPEMNALDPEGRQMLRRRLYRLNVADIPAGARAQLLANRFLSVTLTQARVFIRNKTTDAAV